MDITKRQVAKKGTKLDELTREDNLSVEARSILQNLAIEFVEACFNRESLPFLASIFPPPSPTFYE
jgi:replication fork protection complex subunit Tof1/Swi1